jgi:hypothetical protein
VTVTPISCTEAQRIVSDLWPLTVLVADADGFTASVTPTASVTLPDGSTATPTMTRTSSGDWRAEHTLTQVGRHVATVTASGYGSAGFWVEAVVVTPAGNLPSVADATTYLGSTSWSSQDIGDALAVEKAAQRARCTIPAYYPDDLRGALLRRVARNLGMRSIPLAQPVSDVEAGGPNLPPYDPEINRLERPHWRFGVA